MSIRNWFKEKERMSVREARQLNALERTLSNPSEEPINLSYPLIETITQGFSVEIGRGGFGVVYLGSLPGRKIAVKKLFNSHDLDDKQFTREVSCLIRAKHENIVRFLGYCADTQGEMKEFDGRHVLVDVRQRILCFEYVPNGNVYDYLREEPSRDEWKKRYQMIMGICQGLNYLHKELINHLDLKPENVMLDSQMKPKITDFGLSRRFLEGQSRVVTQNIYGTPGYIAPEAIDSGEISYKSDIFSLGIIIIKLLSGRNRYDLENWQNLLDVDGPEAKICIKIAETCLHADQHKRPTIGEIIHELNELQTRKTRNDGTSLKHQVYVPRPYTYTYEELAEATSNFAEDRKLGNGAFGGVYQGRLPGIDMTVAIYEMVGRRTAQAKNAFHNEIRIMGKLQHRNVLDLLGWCDQGEHLLLVYEIMQNGNLDERLYPSNSPSLLSWPARCKILVGIASGLQYLHRDCPEAILHRDIKPASIMLDNNFNAKLADFGLVTRMSHGQTWHLTYLPTGTPEYIDPVYEDSGRASGQSDVYGLGVMLLEIACGVKPTILQPGGQNSLIEKVRECKAGSGENSILEAVDKWLPGPFDEQIRAVLELGLSCVQTDVERRPHAGLIRTRLDTISTNGAEASTSP